MTTKKSTRPLTAESYRRAAIRARILADEIICWSGIVNPTALEKRRLTLAIHQLAAHARSLSARHRGLSVAEETAEGNREC